VQKHLSLSKGSARGEPKLHLIHHQGRKVLELFNLCIRDFARFLVYYTKSAEVVSVVCLQRNPKIKA
jgi:hypothetical protein